MEVLDAFAVRFVTRSAQTVFPLTYKIAMSYTPTAEKLYLININNTNEGGTDNGL